MLGQAHREGERGDKFPGPPTLENLRGPPQVIWNFIKEGLFTLYSKYYKFTVKGSPFAVNRDDIVMVMINQFNNFINSILMGNLVSGLKLLT